MDYFAPGIISFLFNFISARTVFCVRLFLSSTCHNFIPIILSVKSCWKSIFQIIHQGLFAFETNVDDPFANLKTDPRVFTFEFRYMYAVYSKGTPGRVENQFLVLVFTVYTNFVSKLCGFIGKKWIRNG